MRSHHEGQSIMIDTDDCKYRFHDRMINCDSCAHRLWFIKYESYNEMYYQKLLKAANFIQKRAKNGHF